MQSNVESDCLNIPKVSSSSHKICHRRLDNGCGSVGKAVTSDPRDPFFKTMTNKVQHLILMEKNMDGVHGL